MSVQIRRDVYIHVHTHTRQASTEVLPATDRPGPTEQRANVSGNWGGALRVVTASTTVTIGGSSVSPPAAARGASQQASAWRDGICHTLGRHGNAVPQCYISD